MDAQEYDLIRKQTRRMHPMALREFIFTLREIRSLAEVKR